MSGTKFSRNEELARTFLRVGLGLFLVSPFLIWLSRIQSWEMPPAEEWQPALVTALTQAGLSAVLSLFLGWAMFCALQAWRGWRVYGEMALLLPNMIPPLFLGLGMINLVSGFISFPYGTGAVIASHVLLNSGLVAIALDRLILHRLGGIAETAWVLGARPAYFWRAVGIPFLRGDLACLFLFVFSICFTSFSLPLMLSGQRAVTLEVAIFDAIRVEGRWDKAVLLAAFQSLFLFLLAWLLPQPFWPPRPARRSLQYLAWKGGRSLILLPALLLVMGWLWGLWGSRTENIEAEVWSAVIPAMFTTVSLGIAVGLLHLILFVAIAFASPHKQLNRFLNGFLSPSPVITGFALLLIPGDGDIWSFLKIAVALTLVSLPLLYRWMVHSALAGLANQVRVARLLGSDWGTILFEVVWPQTAQPILRASGLAALWACGDFALSGMLAGNFVTLPLIMEDLMGNYRMEAAQLLMLPLVLLSLGVYFLFVKAAKYVVS